MGRGVTERPREGWDDLNYEELPRHRLRPSPRELEARPAILLAEPRQLRPGHGRRCHDCGGWYGRLTPVRSGAWRGELCGLCLAEARAFGARVEALAAE